MVLPADLRTAEGQALEAVRSALAARSAGRWTVELRFEGLRLLPVALRLLAALNKTESRAHLVFPDAGAAALARRDSPEQAGWLSSLGDRKRLLEREAQPALGEVSAEEAAAFPDPADPGVLVLVEPAQADYTDVEQICQGHRGAVVLLNSRLEDAAIGIGSVARERRRGFLSTWEAAYALIPRDASALRRAFPEPWELYRQDPDGYRLASQFETKPDTETLEQALALEGQGVNVGAGLGALDRFIEGLRN
ncbi:DUF1995 family protein [Cyanobium sp. Morenito 9A2]|uniref:DUF1995 family protein n=1 Tax=Cyanobium sp. Morenito 9A2 TaxID=2823718 RepID=UPI0020CD995B|nr:DUF1995 family protein [Cyanobium sp. Morenito 9A2]MCP9850079.1 DUF1995 family protein [Cyanobium sp. Morenito 9A2]